MSDNAYFNPQSQILFEKTNRVLLSFPPVSATGTAGLVGAPNAAGFSTFTDTVAADFTAAMVGQTITISGSIHSVNDGTFQIVGFTSATVISIYNPTGLVDTDVDVWSVVPSPTIIAGDINQAYIEPRRVGTGVTLLTSTDPFPEFCGIQVTISPSTGNGTWTVESGNSVQNIGSAQSLFYAGNAALNSISVPFTTYASGTATDMVPTNVSGTAGVQSAPASQAQVSKFADAAGTFTLAMVGSPITITGGTHAVNHGTFTIVSFVNPTTVYISNVAAVADTALDWTVAQQATASVALTYNNGPTQ